MMNKSLEKQYFAEATTWDEGMHHILTRVMDKEWRNVLD